jgi:hypothetical protein
MGEIRERSKGGRGKASGRRTKVNERTELITVLRTEWRAELMNQVVGLSVWSGFTIPDKPSELAPYPVRMLGDSTDIRFRQ